MFDIAFVSDVAEQQPDGWAGLWGRTQFGAWEERFLSPLDRWQRFDYERQWIEAAQRLLGSEARAGFFTSAFRCWWVMWHGQRVFDLLEFPGFSAASPTENSVIWSIKFAKR